VWPRKKALTCQQLVELVTEYLEGTLSRGDRARFEAHIDACVNCREYLAQFRQTMELTGALSEDDVDPVAREALFAQFRDWRRTSGPP
jgi:anti-sigma factor RsiW